MSIRFLLDENIPYALIDFLETKGFSVDHLKKINKGGIRNGEVYQLAEENSMWIITRDADFQNYYKFISHKIGWIILIKLSVTKTEYLVQKIKSFFNQHEDKLSKKHLIIVEDEMVKIY
jgi:predicted nuclease of predicted toxin-antitoxin system